MLSRRSVCRLIAIFAIVWTTRVVVSLSQAQDSWEDDFKTNSVPGKRTFTSTCAGCHGLDGRGSDRAPNIVASTKVQHLSDAQVSGIISNGITGTGMPAFHSLNPAQVRSIVSYLRILQGRLQAQEFPGNAGRGKKLFYGKGECASCHTVSGEGGFMGPDLSTIGSAMSVKAILDSILNPDRVAQSGYKSAAVTTRDSTRVEGIVRNEDNFSVQLQTKDGSFQFFQKSELQSIEYLGQSFMPDNYGERLSRSDLNDLASYLMSAGSSQQATRGSKE